MTRLPFAILLLCALGCAPAPTPPAGIAERYSGKAVADAGTSQTILVETYAYWDAIASRDWQGAYDRFTDDYKAKTSLSEWQSLGNDAWAARPRILSIHWTKAAHRQHGPELYAIVEWTARKASSGSQGTLIWRQEPDGSFKLEKTIVRKLIRPKR